MPHSARLCSAVQRRKPMSVRELIPIVGERCKLWHTSLPQSYIYAQSRRQTSSTTYTCGPSHQPCPQPDGLNWCQDTVLVQRSSVRAFVLRSFQGDRAGYVA